MRAISYVTVPLAGAGMLIKQMKSACTLDPGPQDIV